MNIRKEHIENSVLLAFWMAASGLYAVYLGKDMNYNLLNYHIYNPYAFLQGRIADDVAPAGIQTYLNPLMDVPFYLMVRSLPAIMAGFLLGAVQGVNGWQP